MNVVSEEIRRLVDSMIIYYPTLHGFMTKQIIHNVDNVRIVEQLQGIERGKASRSLSVVSCDDEFSY